MKYILKNNKLYSVSKGVDINKYAKEMNGVVIDETHDLIIKRNKILDIDFKLDKLARDLEHNETYANDLDYQATKDDILIKIKNLRDDREILTNEK
jgi:RecJ-like exonuclease